MCTSVDTVERCAMCYFVNGGHCDIEFYMFHNVSSYEVEASYELGTSVFINLQRFCIFILYHIAILMFINNVS